MGGEFNVWTEFVFTTNHNFFLQIDDDYENECDDFQDVLFNFEQMLRMS